MHSTNYTNTFIEIAEDSPTQSGQEPPIKNDKKTVANLQFEILLEHPYKYTSDDILFTVHAIRKGFPKNEWKEQRAIFFSKGQPCFRASPLTKRYGWGVHSDADGKVAMFAVDSKSYNAFVEDDDIAKVKAMRSKRV